MTDTMNMSELCEMCCMNKPFFKKCFFSEELIIEDSEIWNAPSSKYLILLACPNSWRLIPGVMLADVFYLALHYYLE